MVSARTASLIGLRHVTLNEIERRLLLASDVPGQSLTSTLERGATPGGTQLVLETKQSYVTGSIGIDNDLPQSLRNFEWTGSLAVNSALGLGEQAYVSGTSGYNLGQLFSGQSPIQVFGGGVLLPIGVDGFKINPEYTNSVTRPIPPAGTPQTTGYYQRFDLRASYPLLLTRAQAITVQGTYEWAEESLVANGFASDLYLDRYSAARLQLEDRLRLPWDAQADVTGVFSQGLGGRDAADAAASGVPLSQQGSSPTFSKLALNVNYSQPLPYEFQFALIGQAQTSFRQAVVFGRADGARRAAGRLRLSRGHVHRPTAARPCAEKSATPSPSPTPAFRRRSRPMCSAPAARVGSISRRRSSKAKSAWARSASAFAPAAARWGRTLAER